MIRTYTDLSRLYTLEDRFDYLCLGGEVGRETFGYERYLNQAFYRSREWRNVRSFVRARDEGMDLGVADFPIQGDPYIHHMNPLTPLDFEEGSDNLLDPEGLISVSLRTHNAIHYGNRTQLPRGPVIRTPGDTHGWGKVLPLEERFRNHGS
jgi:hypothetical protein